MFIINIFSLKSSIFASKTGRKQPLKQVGKQHRKMAEKKPEKSKNFYQNKVRRFTNKALVIMIGDILRNTSYPLTVQQITSEMRKLGKGQYGGDPIRHTLKVMERELVYSVLIIGSVKRGKTATPTYIIKPKNKEQ